jgi:hypothetical protein
MEPETARASAAGEPVALQIALAEYQFLQSARAQAQEGSSKRYDANLVALGFVGAVLSLLLKGNTSATVLRLAATAGGASVFLLGQVTFRRLIEFTITSTTYTRGLNSIRRFLLELRPELRPFFVLPTNETTPHIYGVSTRQDRRVLLFNRAGSVAILNSLAAGAVIGLWVGVGLDAVASGMLLPAVGGAVVGSAAATGSTAWHYIVQRDRLHAAEREYRMAMEARWREAGVPPPTG